MKIALHILIPFAILIMGVGSFYGIKGIKVKKEKKSKSVRAQGKPGPPVIQTTVIPLTLTDHTVHIESQGEIRTHNATSLTPQISGRVIEISPKFEDGAFFNKGDVLLKLEIADYITEVISARAQLARAEAAFTSFENDDTVPLVGR